MLIQNYGLFWKRSDVFWGHQGVTGHLKGLKADNLKSDAVDFRNQQGVYVLYDDNFRLLYQLAEKGFVFGLDRYGCAGFRG